MSDYLAIARRAMEGKPPSPIPLEMTPLAPRLMPDSGNRDCWGFPLAPGERLIDWPP
ncbi:MAG: hypothetical protein WD894_20265 [Pirellulales bacterium]